MQDSSPRFPASLLLELLNSLLGPSILLAHFEDGSNIWASALVVKPPIYQACLAEDYLGADPLAGKLLESSHQHQSNWKSFC